MKFIIGLGNPEEKYQDTRHNVGFLILDALAKESGLSWETNRKLKAEIIVSRPLDKGGKGDFILVKPLTYMNLSGEAAQAVLKYYLNNPPNPLLHKGGTTQKDWDLSDNLTVVHDDLDIDLGKYKISVDSRSAGHNGVQSIIDSLGTKNFKRIRVGIKTEAVGIIPAEKFVLQRFNREEMGIINNLTDEIIKIIKV